MANTDTLLPYPGARVYPSSLALVPEKWKLECSFSYNHHSYGKGTHEYKWPSPKVTLKYLNCNTSCCNGAEWVDSNVAKVWIRFILGNRLSFQFSLFLTILAICYTYMIDDRIFKNSLGNFRLTQMFVWIVWMKEMKKWRHERHETDPRLKSARGCRRWPLPAGCKVQ